MVLLSQKIQINLLTVNNLPDLLNIHDLNASPVAGVHLFLQMAFTHISGRLKAFLMGTTQQESSSKSMYGEATLLSKKSTMVTQIIVPIRFH
ncbi:hypothetical protein DOH76_24745 [Salmonella enterica subsp. enterica serovar Oranienburg]|nr:hypothetical protein [Salmonella enterica subsp. enterica serovar Oranienburg]